VLGWSTDLVWRVDREYAQDDYDAPHDARVAIAAHGDLPPIVGQDLSIVVTELLANAIRHSTPVPGGRIRLTIRRQGDVVRVEVRDPGGGFPLPDRQGRDVSLTDDAGSDFTVPDPAREGGLGLIVVDRISSDWGLSVTDTTLVWSSIEIPG
jgi:anti-sigma regulatory factor (Ser/Thr protein kinase)